MVDLIYPTGAELTEIAQDIVLRMSEARPIFDVFPMRDVDSHVIMWEQQDNYFGLQQLRGLNGKPNRVKEVGGKRFSMEPGVYGEFSMIDEIEITARRAWGQYAGSVDVTDLVRRRQDQLLTRRLDRIEYIIWTLLINGTFSISTPEGVVAHTDTYTFLTHSAGVPWATVATAAPIADMRAVQLLGRGTGASFGQQATAWMNLVTATELLGNLNASDLAGKRLGLGTLNSLDDVNQIFAANGLPRFIVYDEGYRDDTNTFVPYIPDNKVVIIGARRDGSAIGQYSMTRNANNPGLAPGAYMKVIDNINSEVPRGLEVHDGHNGGPEIHYPGAIVVLTTS